MPVTGAGLGAWSPTGGLASASIAGIRFCAEASIAEVDPESDVSSIIAPTRTTVAATLRDPRTLLARLAACRLRIPLVVIVRSFVVLLIVVMLVVVMLVVVMFLVALFLVVIVVVVAARTRRRCCDRRRICRCDPLE